MPRDHPFSLGLAPQIGLALALSLLAGAATAATISVTTTADADVDDAFCSLREAIVAANTDAAYHGCPAGAGADRVVFALSPPVVISLASGLPTITSTLSIRGVGATQTLIDGQNLHQLLVLDSVAGGEWLGVEDLTLARGLAPTIGGGAYIAAGETASFRRVAFTNNTSNNSGGGLGIDGSESAPTVVAVDECWFGGNRALGPASGGGMRLDGAAVEVFVDRTTFSGNRAEHANGSGGAISLTRASLTVTRSTISGNSANAHGGGIMVSESTVPNFLLLRDTTVTDNESDADGSTDGDGGGIYFGAGGSAGSTLEIANSIVAANHDALSLIYPDIGFGLGVNVNVTTHGFNLVGANEGCATAFPDGLPNANGDRVGTIFVPIDPELEPLAPNGGFTSDHAPSPVAGSPVIDQGSCPGSGGDQRGYGDAATHVRVVDLAAANAAGGDGCDIGAHELGGAPGAEPDLFADDFEAGHFLYWDRSTS